jgi:hypothetical protein
VTIVPVLTVRQDIPELGTTPTVAHVYLISDLRNSTVVDGAMWSDSPPAVDWPTVNDDELLAATGRRIT